MKAGRVVVGRRGFLGLAGLLALLPAAGCAGEKQSRPLILGDLGAAVVAQFSPPLRLEESSVVTAITGDGKGISDGDFALLKLTVINGEDGQKNTEQSSEYPFVARVSEKILGKKLHQLVVGVSEGSRLVAIESTNRLGVNHNVITVIDVLYTTARGEAKAPPAPLPAVASGPGGAPQVNLSGVTEPTDTVFGKVIVGEGAQVQPQDSVVLNYEIRALPGGEIIDTTWPVPGAKEARGPVSVPPSQLFPGLAQAITDQRVGSRVVVMAPPASAQGKSAVFAVVDILARHSSTDQ